MSSRSLNNVQLIGNLTRDPELRYTPQGTPVCTFGVATNRDWTDQSGQRQEETEFHRIVAWQKLAELCSQLLFKGRKVYVDGRLQTRKWTGADNQEHKATEVVINNMIVLDSKQREGMGGEPSRSGRDVVGAGQTGAVDQPDQGKSDGAVSAEATPAPATDKKAPKAKASKASKAKPEAEKAAPAGDQTEASQDKGERATDAEEVSADDIPF